MSLPDFDFGLGETIDLLRDSVANFCANEIAPIAADVDRSNVFRAICGPSLASSGIGYDCSRVLWRS